MDIYRHAYDATRTLIEPGGRPLALLLLVVLVIIVLLLSGSTRAVMLVSKKPE